MGGEIKADTPSSLCFTTGKTVVVGNMLLDKRFTRVKNRGAPDVISQLCVPLISKVAEAKMETEGLLGDGDPVRAAFAAENAAANTAGKDVTINITTSSV